MNTALVPTTNTADRRGFSGGLLVAVAAGSLAIGAAIGVITIDSPIDGPETAPAVEFSPAEHIRGVQDASPRELAATYGNVPFDRSHSDEYVAGVLPASPEELAATYGNVPFEP
jgi:hypothetical protein